MLVNERIKLVRKTLNLSQTDFAKAIFISNGYIADLENDHKKAVPRILRLISLTFGVSEEWLRDGAGDMFYKSPEEKKQRLISLFSELPPRFQDYVMLQIEQLLRLSQPQEGP
ncbi:MAG: helix-turn-helix transcriptional regulator [Spirochaetaceae bacterium]|nr:helix-turn-helix transcriptional regulator [Spirochaetaceae bacterium]